jgi:hypothetical protein
MRSSPENLTCEVLGRLRHMWEGSASAQERVIQSPIEIQAYEVGRVGRVHASVAQPLRQYEHRRCEAISA